MNETLESYTNRYAICLHKDHYCTMVSKILPGPHTICKGPTPTSGKTSEGVFQSSYRLFPKTRIAICLQLQQETDQLIGKATAIPTIQKLNPETMLHVKLPVHLNEVRHQTYQCALKIKSPRPANVETLHPLVHYAKLLVKNLALRIANKATLRFSLSLLSKLAR